MKVLSYIIAIAVILCGSWFSYSNMNQFAKTQEDRIELDNQNKTRSAFIVKTKKEAKTMEAERDQVKASLADADAELDITSGKILTKKREASAWNSKIAEQDRELEKTQELIASIKAAFKELAGDVELGMVPELVTQLEDDVKKANRELEEQQDLTEEATERVKKNEDKIAGLDDRIQARKKRIAANKVEGRISATNHNWGFAIINVPDEMPLDNSSKLIVKRGTALIGKLSINAIEGNRIIADIDYPSMTAGMVVQPGDAVVLAKPVTN
jgi:hypothetical protein